ncbi:MAG: hypothetical protein JW388_1293 [Nitrospira sp.]|nr:hypothetical protein [Nitrospira sp.]
MNVLTSHDLLPAGEYERQREQFRAQVIALKQRRRISLGPLLTLVFENRETLRFQTQEMIRVEQILDARKVQEELDVYNALMPGFGELSATLLIEITEPARMKEWLDVFMGLDHGETVAICAGGEQAFGLFEGGHSHETKISAVHFVRFAPTAVMTAAIADLHAPVTLTVRHREYHAEASVSGSLREEWLKDLR